MKRNERDYGNCKINSIFSISGNFLPLIYYIYEDAQARVSSRQHFAIFFHVRLIDINFISVWPSIEQEKKKNKHTHTDIPYDGHRCTGWRMVMHLIVIMKLLKCIRSGKQHNKKVWKIKTIETVQRSK